MSSTSSPTGPARPSAIRSSTSTAASACCSSYASKAKRELPNERVLVEGPPEQLGKHGQFLGQHLLTPLLGVAVQINAFNFPVWGPLEKLAPALIAGVPSLIKPASQTGYLTARMVELIIDGRAAARRRAAAGQRRRRGPARPSHRAGPAQLHRLGQHRPAAAVAPERGRPVGAVQRRSRLAEHVGPRPRRPPGHAGVRPLRQPAGHRDDRQGRAEVHRDPPRLRSRRAAGRRHRRRPRSSWPPSWSATRPTRPCGWARSPASTSGRRCAAP